MATSTKRLPLFLSVVIVLRNQAELLEKTLSELLVSTMPFVDDLEVIIVDNASDDDSVEILHALTSNQGLPNLQIYTLTHEIDKDLAFWVGLENALGDFTIALDPHQDNLDAIPEILEAARTGSEIVFVRNLHVFPQSAAYRSGRFLFHKLYQWFNGIHLTEETPTYRLLSRRVINFIQQHPSPALFYRRLPSIAGFSRSSIEYNKPPLLPAKHRLFSDHFAQGIRLLFSSTKTPLRLVTSVSLFGAVANLIYSFYVIIVFLLRNDVAPGWVTLSLQQSGMFFLFSLVFLVLGEYILLMAADSNQGSPYHIAQEFSSTVITRHNKLNLEETQSPDKDTQNNNGI